MIPNLLDDLHMIYKLDQKDEDKDIQDSPGEEWQGNSDNCQMSQTVFPVLDQDLNCPPNEEESESRDNEIDVESSPGS